MKSLVTVNHKEVGHDDDKIIDLVMQGYKLDQHKNPNHVFEQWSCSDSEHLDNSVTTEISIPSDNSGLLQEVLYTHKNKSDSSEVVLPAEAFDSDSSTSSISPVLRIRKDMDEKCMRREDDDTGRKPYKGADVINKGLGRRGELKEKNIIDGIGLDRLTKLGRVNAARVLVDHVAVNKDQVFNNERWGTLCKCHF